MFTGIVEEMGTLVSSEPAVGGSRLVFKAETVVEGTAIGDSISVNGCCLTVVDLGPGWWAADAVPETLARSNLGSLQPGERVNLERSISLGSRLGGHLVQGHVDAVAAVLSRTAEGQGARLAVGLPEEIAPLVAEKGSIALDGVSLTVAAASRDRFEVALIPETLERTTLGEAAPGSLVNLEADLLARQLARLLAFSGVEGKGISGADLLRWGYGGEAPR